LPRDQLKSGTVELIREMAAKNRLWGAERIRGELLKIGVRVSKRTIQKYMRSCRRNNGGQTWSTFIKNHAQDIWSCDFVQSYDLLFRPVFLFFVVHLASRRVVHVATTRNPSQEWTAQQIRNATMDSAAPKFLIRDRDAKFGAAFDRAATGAAIRIIKTAVRAPDMNAIAERFAGSLRREMLDHVLVLDDHHLARIAREYVAFFNPTRPHQGIAQRTPVGSATASGEGEVIAYPVVLATRPIRGHGRRGAGDLAHRRPGAELRAWSTSFSGSCVTSGTGPPQPGLHLPSSRLGHRHVGGPMEREFAASDVVPADFDTFQRRALREQQRRSAAQFSGQSDTVEVRS
jgi:transposase InsO family protein